MRLDPYAAPGTLPLEMTLPHLRALGLWQAVFAWCAWSHVAVTLPAVCMVVYGAFAGMSTDIQMPLAGVYTLLYGYVDSVFGVVKLGAIIGWIVSLVSQRPLRTLLLSSRPLAVAGASVVLLRVIAVAATRSTHSFFAFVALDLAVLALMKSVRNAALLGASTEGFGLERIR